MNRSLRCSLFALATIAVASGARYYVATDGKIEQDGSRGKPSPSALETSTP